MPSQGAAVTPREIPVPTRSPRNSRLTVSGHGTYTYPWLTQGDWEGAWREVVLTRDDGVRHRAFFRFV